MGQMAHRRLSSIAVSLCALTAALALACASAWAGTTHRFLSSFGSFQNPQALAVQQAAGDVLVVNQEAGKVERFDSAGNPVAFSALGSNAIDGIGGGECATVPADCDQTPQDGFAFGAPAQTEVAVDESGGANNGDIYVTDTYHNVLDIFAADGHYLGQLSETHNGGFSPICGVAVDKAGDVYVADMFGGVVHRFEPLSTPVQNSNFVMDIPASACQLAVDSSGDLFAAGQNGGPVSKYDSAGNLQYALDSNAANGVAVDPSTDNVYVAESSQVVQFDASSSIAPIALGSFGAGHVSTPAGVAVLGSTGEAFVSDNTAEDITVFGPGVAAPDATTGPATGVSDTKATVEGGVNPDETATEWQFQYGTDTSYGQTAPASPESAGNGSSEVPVSTELSGLTAGTIYHYRLVAIGANGTTYGSDQTFTTQAPPSVDSQSAEPVGKATATLNAQIDPWGAETSYRFEYGPSESYGTSTGSGTLSAGFGDQPASAEITGLTPGATYHYRAVATNGLGGPVDGPDQTFTTTAALSLGHVYASGVGASEAILNAEIDPLGDATSYRFEYGPTESYGTSVPVPDASAGSGTGEVTVSQALASLPADTRFHYRVVATNAHGTVVGEDRAFTTFALEKTEADTCPNAAHRAEQHSQYLPDCRAYELVSPTEKNGVDVSAESSRTHASAGESPGLPAAVAFTSIGGFADVQGIGIGTEYMAERDGAPGTSGWSTHAITPEQEPLSYNAIVAGYEPSYQGEMSSDLTMGIFKSWSPLTDAPNMAHVPDLYARSDLRAAGAGFFRLITNGVSLLPAPDQFTDARVFVAGASSDFQHVIFETKDNLTSDASGRNVKLYKTDGSTTRLLSGLACPGQFGSRAQAPCSSTGLGLFAGHYSRGAISTDGSRVEYTAPVAGGEILDTPGAASQIFQLDDRGTSSTADDAVVKVNASEAATPGPTQAATFETASDDGSRVFFFSNEALTDDAPAGGGLYMWARQSANETQSVTVDATGGTFTLTAHAQPSFGSGTLSNGSTSVTDVTGSFAVGQTITAPDIQPGTTIVAAPNSTSLTLSAPATADGQEPLSASVDATTPPLANDATAAQVQSALEALGVIGTGNVAVSGGPGALGGGVSYEVTFTGSLAGVNVAPLTADGSALAGGAGTAAVAVTNAVRNLTRIAAASSGATVLGISRDGHRVYFASVGPQLVNGGPPVTTTSALYHWEDVDGTAGGRLSFVGGFRGGDVTANANSLWANDPRVSRVSPDGRFLMFEVTNGSALRPHYDQSGCTTEGVASPTLAGGGCAEVYLYRADTSTPTDPDVTCASCPSGPPTSHAWVNIRRNVSAMAFSTHLDHALSDDGRYVFFTTADPLVPEDTNGKFDAYEYDSVTGQVHLLSSGKDTSDSYFMDASADSHDAYILTRERLVGWDTDNAYDLYDVRVDGGFPDPPPPAPECGGDACHGQALGALTLASPASYVFAGAGNLAPPRQAGGSRHPALKCRRGQVKRRMRGRMRCVRRSAATRHAAGKRGASSKRGAK
jgi:sugar lactone lactonase YvrE